MKFKMTKEQINDVNELLKNHSDSLTAFYDEGAYHNKVEGIIIGALIGCVTANICWIIKTVKDHKKSEEES